MKIEKINDNQIRCTLSHQDLVDRELKLSELAYGTEKAKALFHDMMQQASFELGFKADNIPIMIEAIPVSRETLILIITKVENPDELDTRFSRFSPDSDSEDHDHLLSRFNELSDLLDGADDEIEVNSDSEEESGVFENEYNNSQEDTSETADENPVNDNDPAKIFAFSLLDDIIKFAKSVNKIYYGINDLYKDNSTGTFFLVLYKSDHTVDEFTKVCNIASEYGRAIRSQYATISHFSEHFELFIGEKAVKILASL